MDKFTEYFLVWTILGLAGTANGIIGFDACFKKRRENRFVYIAYFLIKTAITSWYASALIFNPPSLRIQTIWMVQLAVFAVTSFVVLWYTWDGDPLKIGIVGIASDTISGTSMIAGSIIVNLIRGRGAHEDFMALTIADAFVIVLISIAVYALSVRILRRAIERLKKHEITHRIIMTVAVVGMIAGLTTSNIETRIDIKHGLAVAYVMFAIIVLMGIFVVSKSIRLQISRRAMLKSRAEMTEAYVLAIDAQAENIDKQQRLLDYIKERIDDSKRQVDSANLDGHIEELKKQADALKRGVYTGSITVDAVLTVYAKRLEELGWKPQFNIADIKECENKAAEISMILLRHAEAVCRGTEPHQDKRIEYSINKQNNQILFTLELPTRVMLRSVKKELRDYISKEDPVNDRMDRGRQRINIMTEAYA